MISLLLYFAFATNTIPPIQAGYYELVKGDQECSSGSVRWIKTEKEKILVISEAFYFNFSNGKKAVTKSQDNFCTTTTYTDVSPTEIRVKSEEKCKKESTKTRAYTLSYADPTHLFYSGTVTQSKKNTLTAHCEWKQK